VIPSTLISSTSWLLSFAVRDGCSYSMAMTHDLDELSLFVSLLEFERDSLLEFELELVVGTEL